MNAPAAAAPNAVELVTIGDELLLGETVDGNSAWLGRRFASAGIRVVRRATVGDAAEPIGSAVGEALNRTGTVVCTGGLGPTPDDLTKPVVAELFGRELVLDRSLLEEIRRRFERRGLEMPAVNRGQAEVPAGAVVFPNVRGTAPGLALEDDSHRLAILLPGVPAEMRALVEEHVLPFLHRRWADGSRRPIRSRRVRTTGLPESRIAELIADVASAIEPLGLAFLPSATGVDLRLTSWGSLNEDEAGPALDAAMAMLTERLGRFVYATDDEDLADIVARNLAERGLTLAVAESCTGGLIAKSLTDRAGASRFFLGAVVAYADAAKERLLAVRSASLQEHGAVSGPVASEMALGVRHALGGDASIAVTGIAGPGGGTPAKPVGTVWIAASVGPRVEVRDFVFAGDRAEVRERAAQAALAALNDMLTTPVS